MAAMRFTSYDQCWETEWDDMKRYGPFSRYLRRLIGDLIQPLVFETVLDVGCGQGSFLAELQAQIPHIKTCGIDISPTAIDLARSRVPAGEFHVLDLTQQFLDHKFDLVVCSEVLEHLTDDLAAIKNLAYMTGKYLIVSTPQGRMRRFEAEVGHVRNYAHGELVHKLEQNGLDIVRVIEWGFPFYSPLYRNFLDLMGGRGTTGKFGLTRKLISEVIYHMFMFNSWSRGDAIVVLAKV